MLAPNEESFGSNEADARLREAHHRIANDLAVIAGMVRLQAQSLGREPVDVDQVKSWLSDAAGRIDAVGRLHRTLCGGLDGHSASKFLKGICDDAASFAGIKGTRIHCTVDFAHEPPPERLRSLGLLIHELVLNALKHAHPAGIAPLIEVTCYSDARGGLAVDVRDDGVGFPDGFNPDESSSFGLRMMRQLAQQLDALLAFESSPLGLVCNVRSRAVA